MSFVLRWRAAWNCSTDRENFNPYPFIKHHSALQYYERKKSYPLPASKLRKRSFPPDPPPPEAPFMIFDLDWQEELEEFGKIKIF